LQAKEPRFALFAGFGPPRGAVGRGNEPGVAASTSAAARDEHALTVGREIGKRRQFTRVRIFVEHQGADWDWNLQIVSAMARLVGSLAVRAALGVELGMVAKIDQRVLGRSCDDIDRTAGAAIAAIRAATGHELLATETEAPVAAIAGADVDVHLVDEHPFQYEGSRLRAQGSRN